MAVSISCDKCRNDIDVNEGIYCEDCHDDLEEKIVDLENEIEELKERIEELESGD